MYGNYKETKTKTNKLKRKDLHFILFKRGENFCGRSMIRR